jgi:putative sugar O-methyltransferase
VNSKKFGGEFSHLYLSINSAKMDETQYHKSLYYKVDSTLRDKRMGNRLLQEKLLKMLEDERKVDKDFYSAGPYWKHKTKVIANQLFKKGMKGFRGFDSGVGTSFTDNVTADIRNEYDVGWRKWLVKFLHIYPITSIYDAQVLAFKSKFADLMFYKNSYYNQNDRVKELLSTYNLENTVSFGCVEKVTIGNKEYSCIHLDLLNNIDNIAQHIDLNRISSMLEIGGGFGANVQILLQNYKNLKKVFYMDMVPNLIVGTEYLKSLFGESVIEYRQLKSDEKIRFSSNDELEIICITPWQIEKIEGEIDYFYNSHSFVEMPKVVVENYIKHMEDRVMTEHTRIALASHYDDYYLTDENTFDSKELNLFFGGKLKVIPFKKVMNNRNNVLLVK